MLLVLVVITVTILFVLLVKFKLNPFVALITACVFLGLLSGMHPVAVAKSIVAGMGNLLGYIAIVVGFGTMMSKLMAESGAADVIARRMIAFFGEEKVNWAIAGVAYIIGISVIFQVGIVLLIPLLFTIALRARVSMVFVVVPLIATLCSVQHFMPPHPATMAMVNFLHSNLSKTILYGLCISSITTIIAGPLYGKYLSKRITKLPTSELVSKFCSTTVCENTPSFGISVFTMLFPISLMLSSELADLIFKKGTITYEMLKFLGDPSISLFVSLVLALYTFGFSRGFTKERINTLTTECLGPVAMILLVIGAGGSFGKILVDSGVAETVTATATTMNIHPLLLAWIIASVLKITVGSGTVSMITTAGLVSPFITERAVTPELMVMAIGAGGSGPSIVTDSGFWVVKEFFGLTMEETLKTWTVTTTIISFTGISIVGLLSILGF